MGRELLLLGVGHVRHAGGGCRQEAGELPKPALLYRAQVIFDLDNLPEVRLNDEVKGRIEAVAARPLAAGDDVMLDDIASIERFELDDDDPNAAHVTLLLGPKSRWHIVFNWQYNAGLIAEHLARRGRASRRRDALAGVHAPG